MNLSNLAKILSRSNLAKILGSTIIGYSSIEALPEDIMKEVKSSH